MLDATLIPILFGRRMLVPVQATILAVGPGDNADLEVIFELPPQIELESTTSFLEGNAQLTAA